MHFNKMIIAGLLVCCSLTAVACGKNRENTSVVTSEYNAANVKDYEEDGVKYREETGAKQTIIYPLMEHDCADMEQAAVCSINGKQSETDVRDKEGNDLMPRLKAYVGEHGYLPPEVVDHQHMDPSWIETHKKAKDILATDPTTLPNTYLKYYLFQD